MSKKAEVKEMYPGLMETENQKADLDFPVAPLNTLLGFDLETYQIPLDCLQPSKRVPEGVISTRKFKQIVS